MNDCAAFHSHPHTKIGQSREHRCVSCVLTLRLIATKSPLHHRMHKCQPLVAVYFASRNKISTQSKVNKSQGRTNEAAIGRRTLGRKRSNMKLLHHLLGCTMLGTIGAYTWWCVSAALLRMVNESQGCQWTNQIRILYLKTSLLTSLFPVRLPVRIECGTESSARKAHIRVWHCVKVRVHTKASLQDVDLNAVQIRLWQACGCQCWDEEKKTIVVNLYDHCVRTHHCILDLLY